VSAPKFDFGEGWLLNTAMSLTRNDRMWVTRKVGVLLWMLNNLRRWFAWNPGDRKPSPWRFFARRAYIKHHGDGQDALRSVVKTSRTRLARSRSETQAMMAKRAIEVDSLNGTGPVFARVYPMRKVES
jgi:hypothetical protein